MLDEVPAAYPNELDVKLAEAPVVEAALSPEAEVLGVVPDATTEPTIESPVAGALLSIL